MPLNKVEKKPLEKKKMYLGSADAILAGKMMICDAARDGRCDSLKCGGFSSTPHKYTTYHDYSECCHPGKNGFSVPVDGTIIPDEMIGWYWNDPNI